MTTALLTNADPCTLYADPAEASVMRADVRATERQRNVCRLATLRRLNVDRQASRRNGRVPHNGEHDVDRQSPCFRTTLLVAPFPHHNRSGSDLSLWGL